MPSFFAPTLTHAGRFGKLAGCLLLLLTLARPGAAQDYALRDSLTRGKYTLIFLTKTTDLNPTTRQRMIDAFFQVYPEEARRFNPNTLRKVTFVVDPTYDGVAATGNGIVRYNPTWLQKHPEDIDVVTHEVMHIVQAYPNDAAPGWLTEGIADYARYVYGVNNQAGDWQLPAYKAGQNYTNSYRITARFLAWLTAHGHPKLVDALDRAARTQTYTPALWQQQTGQTLDQLWTAYTANPTVKLAYK